MVPIYIHVHFQERDSMALITFSQGVARKHKRMHKKKAGEEIALVQGLEAEEKEN